jgi:DHA1 family tetracycline resistance protein-like MFS transporter
MRKLTPILLLTFVNVIGFSVLIPVVPEVLILYTGKSSGLLYGTFISAYALSQFIAAPVLGALSDRYGRRPILLLSQFGTLLSWAFFASAYFVPQDLRFLGVSLPLIIIAFSRITDGITGGNISVAQAWVSDRTTKKEKTKAFGLIGAMFGMGFLIGPAIGGFTVSTPYHYLGTAIFAFLLSLVTLGFIFFGLKESLPESKRDKTVSLSLLKHLNLFEKSRLFRKHPLIKNLVWLRVAFSLAFVGFTTSIILLLAQIYGLDAISIGYFMTTIGVFSIFNQALLVPRVAKFLGEFNSFFIGLILSGIALVGHFLIPQFLPHHFEGEVMMIFFVVSYFLNLGLSMVLTNFKTIITTNVDESKQGQALGLDESISSFGQGVTPLFAGILYDLVGAFSFAVYGLCLLYSTGRSFYKCLKR